MKIVLAALVGVSLSFATAAHAQDVTGTYQATSRGGAPVVLVLRQDYNDEITGTLSATPVAYDVQGTMTNGRVFGTMKADSAVKFFEAVLHRKVLSTTLYDVAPSGAPDYLSAENLIFHPQADLGDTRDLAEGLIGRDQALWLAFDAPRLLAGRAHLSRRLLVETVYQASALSGRGAVMGIVTTGTLTIDGEGARYDPAPSDRLILAISGQTHEFIIREFQGSLLAAGAAELLGAPHTLHYQYLVADEAEMTVVARFDRIVYEMTLSGWYANAGVRLEIDLNGKGQPSSSVDEYGQQRWTSFLLTGSLRGGQLDIQVREQHGGSIAVATGVLHPVSDRGVGRSRVAMANSVRLGETVYGFNTVEMESEIRLTGGNAQSAIVSLSGSMFRGGEMFGTMVLVGNEPTVQMGPDSINLTRALHATP